MFSAAQKALSVRGFEQWQILIQSATKLLALLRCHQIWCTAMQVFAAYFTNWCNLYPTYVDLNAGDRLDLKLVFFFAMHLFDPHLRFPLFPTLVGTGTIHREQLHPQNRQVAPQ
jgi:hypothetical protein